MWNYLIGLTIFFSHNVASYAVYDDTNYGVSVVDIRNTSINSTDNRIVGGTAATIENYPFTVQIFLEVNQQSYLCGGTLITRRHVLTAAHCLVNSETGAAYSPSLFRVRAGTTNLDRGGSQRRVLMFVVHPAYNRATADNDVAVMVLASNLTLSTTIRTATIASANSLIADNSSVTAVGWGTIHPTQPVLPSVLQQVTVRVVNQATCVQLYRQQAVVTPNMLCAGMLNVGLMDACQGDSGGPLLQSTTSIVVGITSWGNGCGHPQFPGVYARVSAYTQWIVTTVAQYNSALPVGGLSLTVITLSVLCTVLIHKD